MSDGTSSSLWTALAVSALGTETSITNASTHTVTTDKGTTVVVSGTDLAGGAIGLVVTAGWGGWGAGWNVNWVYWSRDWVCGDGIIDSSVFKDARVKFFEREVVFLGNDKGGESESEEKLKLHGV